MCQKCEGNYGLWVLDKIIQNYAESMKKLWEPFGRCLLNSTAIQWKWAGLAVLFSRQLPNGTHNFQHNFLYHLIKNPQTTIALTFLTHNISGVGGVTSELLLTA